MEYNFNLFKNVGGSFQSRISIRTNGQLGLSQGLIMRYELDKGQWYATLYYDADHKVIGVKLTTNKDETGAMRIIVRSNDVGGKTSITAHISAKAFLDFNQIPYQNKTITYEPEWSDQYKMLLVHLDSKWVTK